MAQVVYFLSSMESREILADTRRVEVVREVAFVSEKPAIVAVVDPPIVGQRFGLGARDIDVVLLTHAHEGDRINPGGPFPIFVHVARLLVPLSGIGDVVDRADVQGVGRGELYRTSDDADQHRFD